MQSKDHWEQVYSTKASDTVSWFQPHAEMSMRLIRETGLGRAQPSLMSGQVHPLW